MKIDTKIIKKILYKVDPEAEKDEEFVHNIAMLIHMMEDEQAKQMSKRKTRYR